MDANDRKRIRREIMRSAGLIFGCDYALVSVVTERGEGDSAGWRAIARGPNGERLEIGADDDENALVALLNDVIDRANGQPVMAPRLDAAPAPPATPSATAPLELVVDIRRELDEKPIKDEKK